MPKVSVLIPTYNAAHFLDESISSVLNQTFTDFELIIVDNCSTDNSREVIAKYLTDNRVKYYVNETNIGHVRNFNKCLELGKGEFLKFLCADDKFQPQLLEKFVKVMEENRSVVVVSSVPTAFGLKSNVWEPPFYGLQKGEKVIQEILKNYNYLGHPTNVMFRRTALSVGNFKLKYKWLNDWELWLRMLSIGDCYIIPESIAFTRYHEGQETKTNEKSFSNYFETYTLVKSVKSENELKLDFSEFDIDAIIKKRALDCALALPWSLLAIQKKESRQVFKNALKIAYREKVLIDSFFLLGRKLAKKAFSFLS